MALTKTRDEIEAMVAEELHISAGIVKSAIKNVHSQIENQRHPVEDKDKVIHTIEVEVKDGKAITDKKVGCSICDFTANDVLELISHMKTHTPEEQEVAGRRMAEKVNNDTHTRIQNAYKRGVEDISKHLKGQILKINTTPLDKVPGRGCGIGLPRCVWICPHRKPYTGNDPAGVGKFFCSFKKVA